MGHALGFARPLAHHVDTGVSNGIPPVRRPDLATFAILALVIASIVAGPLLFVASDELMVIAMWFAGAAALGLLTGYTTGASEQPGTAGEFLKFLGAGILVPFIGGVASLLQRPQVTTESYTYVGTQVAQKLTEVKNLSGVGVFHPLSVLGGFFALYGLSAILGIVIGARHREKGVASIKPP
jgi:hypothetical protein